MNQQELTAIYLAEVDQLCRDLRATIEALPQFVSAAADRELKEAFRAKLDEVTAQRDQLCPLTRLDEEPEVSAAIVGMIEKARAIVKTMKAGDARDIALIGAVQHLQHHQIATFGTLAAYAKTLARQSQKRLFGAMLEEERAIDSDLSLIASGLMEPAVTYAAA